MSQKKLDAISERLLLLMDARVSDFADAMPAIERKAFDRVAELLKDLELDPRGKIKPSVRNVRIIARVKNELTTIIANDPVYRKKLEEVTGAFDEIDKLQRSYFEVLTNNYSVPAVLTEIRQLSLESVVEQMSRTGVGVNVSREIQDILTQNITTGGTYNQLLKQVESGLVSKEKSEGALTRYAKQVTTDSLNQYSRQYTQTVSQDLGLVWYKYVGSLRETSRPFCKALIEAKADCMPYIHVSQLPELLTGKICGKQTPLSKKTGLPVGMYENTNPVNLLTLAGGYSCNHAFNPVSAGVVPKALRDKFS